MKNIHIYYASTAGNTYIVVSHLRDILLSKGHNAKIYNVMTHRDIGQADAYIFSSGTYGHGLLQEHMEKFIYAHNTQTDLKNIPCGVIGLGDDKYDAQYNVESASLLSEFVDTHNGNMIGEPLRINKSPLPYLHGKIHDWIETFLEKI